MAVGSVDRLEEIPDRLAFLFEYDAAVALERPAVADVLHEPGAREVIAGRWPRRSTGRSSTRTRSARWPRA